jgi:uncharacterized protein YdeI (YjbR/CyaY-like superfamily)
MLRKTEKIAENLKIISFPDASHFDKWLEKNHSSFKGIWMRIFKKGSGKKSIDYTAALDEALSYGWIDGQKAKGNDESWLQKFTPRGAKSGWSRNNTLHAERLIKTGKMKPSGLKEVMEAKKDGRWQKAYESQHSASLPDDFKKALDKNKKAKSFFETLNKVNVYTIIYRLHTAKKPETRERRFKKFMEMLEKGEKFY